MTRLEKTAAYVTIIGLPVAIVALYFAYLAIPTPPGTKSPKDGPDIVQKVDQAETGPSDPPPPSPPLPTSLTLKTSNEHPVYGQRVTYTARVKSDGQVPGGTVEFSIAGVRQELSHVDQEGKASFTTVVRKDATIEAVYHPDPGYAECDTARLKITAGPVRPVVQVMPPASDPNDKTYTLRAKVSPGFEGAVELTGTVWFSLDGGSRLLPNAPLRDGARAELPGVQLRHGQSIVAEFEPSKDAPHLLSSQSSPFTFSD
jgi:hypothetical protein